MTQARFPQLRWADDLEVNGVRLRMESPDNPRPPGSSDSFQLYKTPHVVRDLQALFSTYHGFSPDRLLELGMWDGGSLALLVELFEPQVAVGLDISTRGDSPYFQQWRARRPDTRVVTRWGVDQENPLALSAALQDAGVDELDLVVDDGAHLLGPTTAAFRELFPRLRPGGLYVIEDYGWAHLPQCQPVGAPWQDEPSMAELVFQLIRVMASDGPVARVTAFATMVAIERGPEHLRPGFDLESLIRHRAAPPRTPKARRAARRLRRAIRTRSRR